MTNEAARVQHEDFKVDVDGHTYHNVVDAQEAVLKSWYAFRAPLIKAQMEAGGPKVTDPAPRGEDEMDLVEELKKSQSK